MGAAFWTLLIKFILPILFAQHESLSILAYIMWDFWWVLHIALGICILKWKRHVYFFALGTSIVEIVIIVTKFYLFLSDPVWNIWKMNWFVNKVFVLSCFIMMLVYFLKNRVELKLTPIRAEYSAAED